MIVAIKLESFECPSKVCMIIQQGFLKTKQLKIFSPEFEFTFNLITQVYFVRFLCTFRT